VDLRVSPDVVENYTAVRQVHIYQMRVTLEAWRRTDHMVSELHAICAFPASTPFEWRSGCMGKTCAALLTRTVGQSYRLEVDS